MRGSFPHHDLASLSHRLLRAPLAARLAGANVLAVGTCATGVFLLLGSHVSTRVLMLVLLGTSMLVALVVNLAILNSLVRDRARARSFAALLVRDHEAECARLGHELHDSIAQSLAALRLQLASLEREASEPALAARLGGVRHAASDLLDDVRALSHRLHPRILADLGIVPAIRHLARCVPAGPKVTVTVPAATERALQAVDPEVAAVIYLVAQAAVEHATHHAAAPRIDLRLDVVHGVVELRVDDDGAGADPAARGPAHSAMGLSTTRERIALLRGTFAVSTHRHGGTSVGVRIPLEADISPCCPPSARR